ncbi:hypothetical protein UFOVP687_26 [uncultured Caudovirales phage]|uniref:Uncharacterized protein n=1 Tax=uncultured Caudovirales phage TaxID=2100421 RepID=A0A6J5NGG8_9CAUD|nr:hypothetical protein UFOVP414_30 [uncultured Caudovirales phage]CAB4157812.1 hypothetical protein UFOVP687_26 [uncultured Caudovirales phage]
MDAIQLVRLALNVISERLLVILALLLSFSLACWTMSQGTPERIITLAIFVLGVFLPILFKIGTKNERPADTTQ